MTKTLPWFKFWNDVLDNYKAQRLAGDSFKTWVNLLSLASRHNGVLPSIEAIAFTLRCPEDDAQSEVIALVRAGLFEEVDGRYRPHDWDHWQRPSGVSTTRVRAHRARKKNINQHVS